MINFRNFFGSISIILVLSGCSSLDGNISNGRYYAPNKAFSFEVPYMYPHGAKRDDNFDRKFGEGEPKFETGSVSFSDDFGSLLCVDVVRFPEKLDVNDKAFLTSTEAATFNIYQEKFPKAEIVRQEFIQWNNRTAKYFVVHIPQGSAIVSGNGRMDVYKAMSAFMDEEYLYIFSTQSNYWDLFKKDASKEQIFEYMKDYLIKNMNTFETRQAGS